MNDQLFQLLLVSIAGDKVAIFGFLALLLWTGFDRRGDRGAVATPDPVPGPAPDPVPTPAPAPPPEPPLQSAKGSWYSQFSGKYEWVDNGDAPGSNALGVPDADQGVAFPSRTTLGQWFEVHAPNGVVSIEQQTDIGPSSYTGRGIDISAAAAERFGYSPKDFPTDGTFQWRSVPTPQAVANLSPVAQAIAYQKVRNSSGAATTPTTSNPAPAGDPPWLIKARQFDGLKWTTSMTMPPAIATWMDNIATQFPEMQAECQMLKSMGAKSWWAWCGGFVQSMLSYSNIRGPFGPNDTDKWPWAKSWAAWGDKVWMPEDGDISNANPQPGDVLVWSFGHVSFYDHVEPDTDTFASTGGDQGTPLRVCTEDIPMSECIAIRRAPAA